MDEATIALTTMTGLLLVSFLGFLIWGIRSGQFKDIEDAKYQIFRSNRKMDSSQRDSEEQGIEARGGEEK